MSLEDVKKIIYDLVAGFFAGATVIWAEQTNTKPPLPYVTLKTNGLKRSTFPIDSDSGRFYNAGTTLEINLYTQGKPIVVGENTTGNFINTAVSDLADFFSYLDSDDMVDIVSEAGLGIMLMPPVRDLTELKNEVKYRYRAMAEAEVSFALSGDGVYGITEINVSGGGTDKMIHKQIETIETIEITGGN